MFYDNVYRVCRENGTTPTTVLKSLGFSSGNVSKWKNGSVPNVDLAYAMAQALGVSLDYLVDPDAAHDGVSHDGYSEWIEIISHIPADRQEMCKDFLRTHMVMPERYADREKGGAVV